MITAPASNIPRTTPDPQRKAVLVVSLDNFDVRYASPLAVEWLGLPANRLLDRSLIFSQPPLSQALTLAVSSGLSPEPTPVGVTMTTPRGQRLLVAAHRADNDAVIDFTLADEHAGDHGEAAEKSASTPPAGNPIPDGIGLQRRLDEMRQDLAALRARIPCSEAMQRGDDPMLFWLWQAEGALAEVSQRFAALCATQRKSTGTYRRPTSR
ncbi:MAG TPA: hypothetical protein VHX44_11565 [Planctomycetota bacterium]|nr:hypothetical protein [Planctomycetota bacterium]